MLAKSTWALIAAAAVAVASVTAAGFILADRAPSTIEKITDTAAGTPGLAWSLDAGDHLGRPFGGFSDPREGSAYSSFQSGFIVAGDTLLTIAGTPTDGYVFENPVMIGVNADDGKARWQAPAHDLVHCSETPLGGKIYCYALNTKKGWELVTYDIDTGVSARRTSPEPIFALATTSDTLYIAEGNVEDNDVRVHSGTYEDVSANWTQTFDVGGSNEELNSDVLTVVDGVGLIQVGIDMAQFDAASGAELWSNGAGDCVSAAELISGGAVAQANSDCASSGISEQILRDADGKVLLTTDNPSWQRSVFEGTSDPDDPVLFGDSAYDRGTGDRLWTDPSLVAGAQSAVTAIVDDTIYVRNTTNEDETGIDLNTGKELWHNDTAQMFTPRGSRGSVIVGTDTTALTAFDVRTGKVVWTAPFVAIDTDPETFGSGGAVEPYGDGWIFSSDRRMIGLQPL